MQEMFETNLHNLTQGVDLQPDVILVPFYDYHILLWLNDANILLCMISRSWVLIMLTKHCVIVLIRIGTSWLLSSYPSGIMELGLPTK